MVALALIPLTSHGTPLTGVSGANAAFDNTQDTLALNRMVATTGVFPRGSGGSGTDLPLGAIRTAAFNFLPGGAADVNGDLLSIASNPTLFALMGTTYGGDGTTTFGLPNLEDTLALGRGTGPGLSPWAVGQRRGSNDTVLAQNQMPAHSHALAGGATTGNTGGSSPLDNLQSSLGTFYAINTGGTFPSSGSSSDHGFFGEVNLFAAANTSRLPGGWLPAEGQILSIASNTALFAVIGTTYGGDGTNTFALPDLRGRTAIGVGARPGDTAVVLGQRLGNETVTLTQNELASHTHGLPGGADTGASGGGLAFSNLQPSLGMNFLISTTGIFPSPGSGAFDPTTPFLGEVVMFAGNPNNIPFNWLPAEGQILSIASNTALFTLLGTNYGGDGQTTFALPDLRGRSVVDESATRPIGSVAGHDSVTLTVANLPAHTHTLPVAASVDEPSTLILLLLTGALWPLTGVRTRIRS